MSAATLQLMALVAGLSAALVLTGAMALAWRRRYLVEAARVERLTGYFADSPGLVRAEIVVEAAVNACGGELRLSQAMLANAQGRLWQSIDPTNGDTVFTLVRDR